MYKTIFEITKMDCPSEENLIRMKLEGISSIANLVFDIPNRKLTVFYNGEIDKIEKSVFELNLGGKKISTEQTDKTEFSENSNQKKTTLDSSRNKFHFFHNRNDNWNNLKINGISCRQFGYACRQLCIRN